MEGNKEHISNRLIQLIIQYIVLMGIACFILGTDDSVGVLVVTAMLCVCAVFYILARMYVEDFFNNIIVQLSVACVYGWLIYMWINSEMLPYKSVVSGTKLIALVVASILIMLCYSLSIVYRRTKLDSGERIPRKAIFIVAVCFILAGNARMVVWQHMSMMAFAVVIMLMIVREYSADAVKLRAEFGYDLDYPGEQIRTVFNTLSFVLSGIVVAVVAIFYSGPYGNYVFNWLKSLFIRLLKLLKLFKVPENIKEIPSKLPETLEETISIPETPESIIPSETEMETETATLNYVTKPESLPVETVVENDEWLMWLMIGCFFVVLLVIVVIAVEIVSKNIRTHKKKYVIGNDVFESWDPEAEDEEPTVDSSEQMFKGILNTIKYNMTELMEWHSASKKVRKLYKREVLGEEKKKVQGFPSDITNMYITDEVERSEIITEIYERARYSEKGVNEDDRLQLEEVISRKNREL